MYATFTALLLITLALAFWQGGSPERLCAGVVLLMALLQFLGNALFGRIFDQVDLVSLIVDLTGFVGMTAIALFANRIWPLWTSAMQLLSCTSHLGREVSGKVEPLVYSILKTGPTFLVLLILLMGTFHHWWRLKEGVKDSAWVDGFQPPAWIPRFLRT